MSERSKIMFVVMSIVCVAAAFVCGVFVGNIIPGPNTFAPDTLSAWVTAAATVGITVLTFILAVETWRLRAAQTAQIVDLQKESIRPNVAFSLSSNQAGVNFMDAKVINSGKGIARKIRFEFLNRDGTVATPDSEPITKIFRSLSMIDHGIESLGVGQELSSFVFSFFDLSAKIERDIFSPFLSVLIQYEDIEGRPYTNSFVVDFVQYKGMSRTGSTQSEKIAAEIKDLRQAFEMVSSSNRRIGVDIFNSDDRSAEAEATRVWLEQQRTGRDGSGPS